MRIKKIRYCLLAMTTMALIAGCQTSDISAINSVKNNLLVANEQFQNSANTPLHSIESPEQIFILPEEAKVKLHALMNTHVSVREQTKAVLDFIVSYADDGLIYDNSVTRTASETLQYSKANCLSLSILAYSLAQEVGMEANFQDVHIPEYWTSELNQTWLNGHVNLRLKKHRKIDDGTGISVLINSFIVDFDPYSLKNNFKTTAINQQRIVAMFYNNKAAIAVAENNYAQAYAYYKAAINADATFAVTWSNLGILYRQHHLMDLAEQVYQHSLMLNPDSINTLSNLAYLYQRTGKEELAKALEQKVLKRRVNNPYYYLMLGTEAFAQQNFSKGITFFEKTLELDPDNHEAYFGLAKSYVSLNQLAQAERYLIKAKSHTSTVQDKIQYQRKLSILNQIARVD
ncbi:tetratricopeptide repeat protein [Rheinheimera salexigens]|nr:tetratricopeptide repeat protein [Rheinheimera salexigens]